MLRGGLIPILTSRIAELTGGDDLSRLVTVKSWGTPLKPSAGRGELCFWPSRGLKCDLREPPEVDR